MLLLSTFEETPVVDGNDRSRYCEEELRTTIARLNGWICQTKDMENRYHEDVRRDEIELARDRTRRIKRDQCQDYTRGCYLHFTEEVNAWHLATR